MTSRATIRLDDTLDTDEVVALYSANAWSSAHKPVELMQALRHSHTLATARIGARLVGLANAISDGHLVVYFPHLLVHPELQRQGVGRQLMQAMLARYDSFHQLMLTADGEAQAFYERLGFTRAGRTVPMWIYAGQDH